MYLISENDLMNIANEIKFSKPSVSGMYLMQEFLKSKQPVEEIASGTIDTNRSLSWVTIPLVSEIDNDKLVKLFQKFKSGKLIWQEDK